MPANPIPLTLITGFLGSGKTTLLNRLIAAPGVGAPAVIVNEFGEVGVDNDLIRGASGGILTIEDGCVCCSVRGDLVEAMTGLLVERAAGTVPAFDRVFVETTGIADPAGIIDMVVSSPALAGRFAIANVVATVDALNGLAAFEEFDEAVRQVAVADCLVVTKCDLAGGEPAGLRDRLGALNPTAVVVRGDDASAATTALIPGAGPAAPTVRAAELLARVAAAGDLGHDHRHDAAADHAHDIGTYCVRDDEPVPLDTLQLFLDTVGRDAGADLLRVKGIVNVAERPGRPAVIHAARAYAHAIEWLPAWPGDDRQSRIVFIARGGRPERFADTWSLVKRFAAGPALPRPEVLPAP